MKKLSEKKSGIIIAGVAVLIVLAALAISLLVYALLRPTRGPSRPDSVWPLPPNDDLQSTVTVSTFSGNVRGRRTTTVLLGKTYFSFKGMQYAVAPLRELRFRVNLKNCNTKKIYFFFYFIILLSTATT